MRLERKHFAREAMSLVVCVLLVPPSISIWDCGKRDINFERLIYYGHGAKAGQWPWHAAIYNGRYDSYVYSCGGSIIDSNTILTSAHCIHTPNGLHSASHIRVHLGRVMLNETNDHTQEHAVSKLIPHPSFHPAKVSYDIALIKLATRINFTAYVQPICLWGMDAGMELIVGANGTIVGFGETENSSLSNHLRVAVVKVAEFWACLDKYRAIIADGMFCAKGHGEVNACRGDSGGGIVYEIAGRWFVRGIVSFISLNSILSCDVSQYTVFTDVAVFREWIATYVDPVIMATQEEYLVENSPNGKLLNFDTCGVSTRTNQPGPFTFPWIGLIETHLLDNKTVVSCQAILISEWYAVGPAHCFDDARGVQTILLGGKQFNSNCKESGERPQFCAERLPIKTVAVHPKYQKARYEHGIALIEFGVPVITKPNVVPICLPVKIEHRNLEPEALVDSMYGYPTPYVDGLECQNAYASGGITLNIDQTKFCVGIHRFTEHHMSGEAIMSVKNHTGSDRYFLRGIGLFGFRQPPYMSVPRLMLNIQYYLSWILYNMNDRNEKSGSQFALTEKWKLLPTDTCGKIVDNRYTSPWIGTLFIIGDRSIYSKTVTLISAWYALTHCIEPPKPYNVVVVGDVNESYNISCIVRRRANLCSPTIQTIQVQRIIQHPQCKVRSWDYNIELIQFAEPADFTKAHVQPICLPFGPLDPSNKPVQMAMISNHYRFKANHELRSSNMKLIDRHVCRQALVYAGWILKAKVTELCTINEYKNEITSRLAGSILQALHIYNNDQRYFLRGLMYPLIYELDKFGLADDVGTHVEWILSNLENNTNDLKQKRASRERFIETALQQSKVERDQLTLDMFKSEMLNFYTCGINYDFNETTKAASDRFPWIGSLLERQAETLLCFATLINQWYAIAPAHCFADTNPDRYTLRFGASGNFPEHDQNKTDGEASAEYQTVLLRSIIKHHDYKGDRFEANIALVLFTVPLATGKQTVVPICLPFMNSSLTFDPTEMIVATHYTRYQASYIEHFDCEEALRRSNNTLNVHLNNATMCTVRNEPGQQENCTSRKPGSPLQTLQKLGGIEQYFLRGLSIFHKNCENNIPEVHVDVEIYLEWISGQIVSNLPYHRTEKLIVP